MGSAKLKQVRAFALRYPDAAEDFPWGEPIIKVLFRRGVPPEWRNGLLHGPGFVWLFADGPVGPAMGVKLVESYDAAIALAGAAPMTHSGLGKFGRLTVPVEDVDLDLLCDWVDESYRSVAHRTQVAALDANPPSRPRARSR